MRKIWKKLPTAIQNGLIGAGAISGLVIVILLFKFMSFIMVPLLLTAIVVLALIGIGTFIRIVYNFIRDDIESTRKRRRKQKLLDIPRNKRTREEADELEKLTYGG
jgi:hypothetical protein